VRRFATGLDNHHSKFRMVVVWWTKARSLRSLRASSLAGQTCGSLLAYTLTRKALNLDRTVLATEVSSAPRGRLYHRCCHRHLPSLLAVRDFIPVLRERANQHCMIQLPVVELVSRVAIAPIMLLPMLPPAPMPVLLSRSSNGTDVRSRSIRCGSVTRRGNYSLAIFATRTKQTVSWSSSLCCF
jgi:hypothetical protein